MAAPAIDAAVVHHVLNVITPSGVDTALAELTRAEAVDREVERAQERQVQHARDAVEALQRQYAQVTPGHARLKADLEARLEQALERLDHLRQAVADRVKARPQVLTPDDVTELVGLTHRLPALWNAPTTTNEDRKQLLRCVLTRVVLLQATPEAFDFNLMWVGGLCEPLRVLRPRGIAQLATEMHAKTGLRPTALAAALGKLGHRNRFGLPLTPRAVQGGLTPPRPRSRKARSS